MGWVGAGEEVAIEPAPHPHSAGAPGHFLVSTGAIPSLVYSSPTVLPGCAGLWNTPATYNTTPRARAVKMCNARPDLCDAGFVGQCMCI